MQKMGLGKVSIVPKQLAEKLIVLAHSPMVSMRRAKLRKNFENEYPDLLFTDEDMYIFVSDQGGGYGERRSKIPGRQITPYWANNR